MNENPTYSNYILILTLDQLIKKKFLDYVNSIAPDKLEEFRKKVFEHNNQLIENLFLSSKEGTTKNKKLQFITKLYGVRDFKPDGKNKGWNGISIQAFINSKEDLECNGLNVLSKYFYNKLNPYVLNSKGIDAQELPRIKPEKLNTLFSLTVGDISNWKDFANHPDVISTADEIFARIKLKDKNLAEFHTFTASYFSRSRRKIHKFELLIAKNSHEVEGGLERDVRVIFKNREENKTIEYTGTLIRKKEKASAILTKVDDSRRAVLFFYIQETTKFKEINTLHGIYIGDSVKKAGRIFSLEFIASRHNDNQLEANSNYQRIVSTLLLRNNNFHIEDFDIAVKILERNFTQRNLINDSLVSIISRVKNHELVLFNYSKIGKLQLSKMKFSDKFNASLASPISSTIGTRKVEIVNHSCKLSAIDTENRIVAKTYRKGTFTSMAIIDFQPGKKHVFTGTFSYFGDPDVFTTYVVAIIDVNNQHEEPRELTSSDIINLQKNRAYKDGLFVLEELRKKTRNSINKISPSV